VMGKHQPSTMVPRSSAAPCAARKSATKATTDFPDGR